MNPPVAEAAGGFFYFDRRITDKTQQQTFNGWPLSLFFGTASHLITSYSDKTYAAATPPYRSRM
jgi:hypothetical protein